MATAIISVIVVLVVGILVWVVLRVLGARKAKAGPSAATSARPSSPAQPSAGPKHRAGEGRATAPTSPGAIQLLDVAVPAPSVVIDPPVVDLKVHNPAAQPAIIEQVTVEVLWAKRFGVLESLMACVGTPGFVVIPPSETYEIKLPDPEINHTIQMTSAVSQTIAPGKTNHFRVLLHTNFPPSKTKANQIPGASSVYMLHFTLRSTRGDEVSSSTIGVACPGNWLSVPRPDLMRDEISRFNEQVTTIRTAISEELAKNGHSSPNWTAQPPRARGGLPPDLVTLDHRYQVTEAFWNPKAAVAGYLDDAERLCQNLADSLTSDMPGGLGATASAARSTLDELPELRRQFQR